MKAPNIQQLSAKKCKPCGSEVRPFSADEAKDHVNQIPGWVLGCDGKSISRDYVMKNFVAAVDLIRSIALVAEDEDHHPDVHLTAYRKLRVDLATHSIGGLSENDFILAAKIDQLPKSLKQSS